MSLGRNGLINCMSASMPGLIPEKMLTDGILMKRPGSQHPSKNHEPFSPQQCCLSHCAQTGLALAHAGQDCSLVVRGNKVTHSTQKAEEKA